MFQKFNMPERRPCDGPVNVRDANDDKLAISVDDHHFTITRFNAIRLMALIALMVSAEFKDSIAKQIKI